MRIALAQIKPSAGDLKRNIVHHTDYIEKSATNGADAVFFPELSLSGYEPLFGAELSFSANHPALEVFQNLSDSRKITIGVGFPEKNNDLPKISTLIFQPKKEQIVYSKQILHEDELMFFSAGSWYKSFEVKGTEITPALCYESLIEKFYDEMPNIQKTKIVIASVAKSRISVEEAYKIYPLLAQKYKLTILMVNSVGFCDNFQSAGISWVADPSGKISGFLEQDREGILIFDTENPKIEKYYF